MLQTILQRFVRVSPSVQSPIWELADRESESDYSSALREKRLVPGLLNDRAAEPGCCNTAVAGNGSPDHMFPGLLQDEDLAGAAAFMPMEAVRVQPQAFSGRESPTHRDAQAASEFDDHRDTGAGVPDDARIHMPMSASRIPPQTGGFYP